jgi:hypothetical protein
MRAIIRFKARAIVSSVVITWARSCAEYRSEHVPQSGTSDLVDRGFGAVLTVKGAQENARHAVKIG